MQVSGFGMEWRVENARTDCTGASGTDWPERSLLRILAAPLVMAVALLLLSACDTGASSQGGTAVRTDTVLVPEVEGPVSGGIRTGEPFGSSLITLQDGYVEEEFFFSGMARGHSGAEGTEAPYTSRILVRRPSDVRQFNGTVVFDWNNVTLQQDVESVWAAASNTVMDRGFIYVGVSAQKQGVDGSPAGLLFWDPDRYGTLSHPGDDFALDIFSQAGQAIFASGVLPPEFQARVQRRIATGASQSAGQLTTYVNEIHEEANVFDGFKPQISGGVQSVRDNLVPILWINSQDEAAGIDDPVEDTDMLRYWEIAGPPHVSNAGNQYIVAIVVYNHVSAGTVNTYDPRWAEQYGELDPGGLCGQNRYPVRYVWSNGLIALDDWLRTGNPPRSIPRLERDESGDFSFDEHGNALGGYRLPVIDVPIASYYAGQLPSPETLTPCAPGGVVPLAGTSQTFTADKLMTLYPTHEEYEEQMQRATDEAVSAGRMLPEHGMELMERVRAIDVTDPLRGEPAPEPQFDGEIPELPGVP